MAYPTGAIVEGIGIGDFPKDAVLQGLLSGSFARAYVFDGTNDFWTRGAALTGVADSKSFTSQFWFDTSDSGTSMTIMRSDVGRFEIRRESTNRIRFIGKNAANTIICDVNSNSTYTSGLHHVVCSVDLATATAHLMIDGADDLQAGATLTDDTIDFTDGSNFGVGANDSGATKFNGELSALFFQDGTYQDVETNIANWICAGGGQADLGADGSTPLGLQPLLFINTHVDDVNANGTNLGTGGNGTVTGTLVAGTDPSNCIAAASTIAPKMYHHRHHNMAA